MVHHYFRRHRVNNYHHNHQQRHSYSPAVKTPTSSTATLLQSSPSNKTKCISTQCFKLLLLVIVVAAALAIYAMDITDYHQHWMFTDVMQQQMDEEDDQEIYKSYFVNTVGCKMPHFPTYSPHVMRFLSHPSKVTCKKMVTQANNTHLWIHLNETELNDAFGVKDINDMSCFYQSVHRNTDRSNVVDDKVEFIELNKAVRVQAEFVKVTCEYRTVGEIFTDYYAFFPYKLVEEKTNNQRKRKSKRVNVLIVGLDSVSRLNFHRQMNSTVSLLLDKLHAVEMFGYNKVGDNTYPNLIPVLTGLDELELKAVCNTDQNFDSCNFLWKDFARHGYRTVFAEDIASLGLFNYFKKGFKNQSTEFNLRPLTIEMEANIAANKMGNVFTCLGGRRPIDVLLSYAKDFIQSIHGDYFGFFWTSAFTHDFLNMPQIIDEDVADFFTELESRLDDTFLIFLSDHGMRWGSYRNTYQGMMEERQPFLYILPPKWFIQEYPLASLNLRRNRRKLTTHFDLHETIKELLDLNELTNARIKAKTKELAEQQPMPRGISLFLPVPETRTCDLAGIAPHWCTCHEKIPAPTNSLKVQNSARFVVRQINSMLAKLSQCQKIYLNQIFEAEIYKSHANMTINDSHSRFDDITVRLQTKPGMAVFEATVRMYDNDDYEPELTGTISRTNLYGKQSRCVNDYRMKLYCFCGS